MPLLKLFYIQVSKKWYLHKFSSSQKKKKIDASNFFLTFHYELVLNLKKSCQKGTKMFLYPLPHSPNVHILHEHNIIIKNRKLILVQSYQLNYRPYLNFIIFPMNILFLFQESRNLYCIYFQFSSIAQSCPTLCDPMNCSTSGLPVHHRLPKFTQSLSSAEMQF